MVTKLEHRHITIKLVKRPYYALTINDICSITDTIEFNKKVIFINKMYGVDHKHDCNILAGQIKQLERLINGT